MDLESARQLAAPLAQELSPYKGSCVSRLFLLWIFPLLKRSQDVEQLQAGDLFEVDDAAKPEALQQNFLEMWRSAVCASGQRQRSGWLLLRVLARLHVPRLKWLWMLRVLQNVLNFGFPLFLNKLVTFVKDKDAPLEQGLFLCLCLFLSEGLASLVDARASLGLESCGLRIRASLMSSILRKVLLLRQDSMLQFSSGKLNNMITTDVDKTRRALRTMHVLILTAPLKVAVSLIALHALVGVSVFIGLSWMLVVILLNPVMMYIMNRLEETQQAKTDERVRKATEVIQSINVIKCYGWEEPATAKVEQARKEELNALWRLYCLFTCFEGIWSSIVPCCCALMFASYSWLNPEHPLTAAQAFTAIALLSMVQEPLFTIPWVLNLIVEAYVAAKRIEGLFFLAESDLPALRGLSSFLPEPPPTKPEEDLGSTAIALTGASFVWEEARPGETEEEGEGGGDGEGGRREFQLLDIAMQVPKGTLVGVVGATGAGKTSLLQALLGEMPQKEGSGLVKVSRHKPLAFLPQQPWIFNATVRQNILFGEPYSEAHYLECLRCCSLDKDLQLLKAGDQTRVGEKGIALSGGQKARVCLARACYRFYASSIFLLDDPYSALDSHVAKSVHEEAILGLLKKKTRVVATNRLEFAGGCDLVLVLEEGKITAQGRFEELQHSSSALKSLLQAQGLEAKDGQVSDKPPALARAVSAASDGPEQPQAEEQEDAEADTEVEEEERATGQIKKEVFGYYLQAMGGCCTVSFLAALYLGSELLTLCLPLWLAVWTASSAESGTSDLTYFLSVYVILSVLVVLLTILRDLFGNVYGFVAAKRLHSAMFKSVLRAPMSFFQDTPTGRIINRFSKDMSEIDKELIWQLINTFVPVLGVVGNFAMVGGIAYFAMLAFLPAFWLYYLLWKYYNKAVLDVKRLSKIQSSPVYDHFNNLCRENAISVVRAFRQVDQQCVASDSFVLDQQRPDYSQMYLSQWFSLRVEHLGCVLLLFVSLFVTLGRGRLIEDAAAALVLNFAGECTGSLEMLIGQIAEFGMAFNCVERVRYYATQLPSEAALRTDRRPIAGWPNRGLLEVKNLQVRYKEGLPLVLKNLSFCTSPGERLGVVGRTGAGKSSLLLALLRIVEPEPG
ncbi:unnamed protein product, partial [Effrenium voratum]